MADPQTAPDLHFNQANMVFGKVVSDEDKEDLRIFFEDFIRASKVEIDRLIREVEILDNVEARRMCHSQVGALRTIGLERAGLIIHEAETNWGNWTADTRLERLHACLSSIERGLCKLQAPFPYLFPSS